MAWWVYKCNSRGRDYQRAYGDWREFFENHDPEEDWGSSDSVNGLDRLQIGDGIVAYQTNRNEVVGLARVRLLCEVDGVLFLYLVPVQQTGFRVNPLKKEFEDVRSIKAFAPPIIKTIYEITLAEVRALLRAAKIDFDPMSVTEENASEELYSEGGRRTAVATVRSKKLRDAAINKYGWECYCCGFKFEDFYGKIAHARAVVHHLETFRGTDGQKRISTVDDVRVVCANCHYVLHLKEPPRDVDELKRLIESRWESWSKNGVCCRPVDQKKAPMLQSVTKRT
jgi:hypothetical protein